MALQGTLRERLLALVEELWTEAEEAAVRRSRVESRVKREDANRMLVALGLPERDWSRPTEAPPTWVAVAADSE